MPFLDVKLPIYSDIFIFKMTAPLRGGGYQIKLIFLSKFIFFSLSSFYPNYFGRKMADLLGFFDQNEGQQTLGQRPPDKLFWIFILKDFFQDFLIFLSIILLPSLHGLNRPKIFLDSFKIMEFLYFRVCHWYVALQIACPAIA